jgi:hypothetical protein
MPVRASCTCGICVLHACRQVARKGGLAAAVFVLTGVAVPARLDVKVGEPGPVQRLPVRDAPLNPPYIGLKLCRCLSDNPDISLLRTSFDASTRLATIKPQAV